MSLETIPADLKRSLQAARRVENAAGRLTQVRAAVAATGALMLAATEAGWPCVDLARVLGVSPNTARARLASARAVRDARGGHPVGIEVTPRPKIERRRRPSLRTLPVDEREWLSVSEAAELMDVGIRTVHSWREYGLLPNTDRSTASWYWYLRADLERVARADRYADGSIRRVELLERIRSSSQLQTSV